MKLNTKIIIVVFFVAIITSMFLPNLEHVTALEKVAMTSTWAIMAAMGFALGLGRDRNGERIVERDFDPEA